MSSSAELSRRLTTGVYVVTASDGQSSGGFTAAWVTPVSFDPFLVAVSVNTGNATWRLIQGSGQLTISVLKAGQLDLARHFGTRSGRDFDKLAAVRMESMGRGLALADAAAWMDCEVERQIPAGDHVVVIARVVDGAIPDPDAAPMLYVETGGMDGSAALFQAGVPKA